MIFGIEGAIEGTFGKSKTKTFTDQTQVLDQDIDRETAAAQRGEQLTKAQRQTAGISDISQLAPEVQELLITLMGQSAGPGAEQDLLSFMQGRATGAGAAIGGDIEGILGAARQTGERAIRARGTAGATRAGSGFNTLVRAMEGRDIAGLETQLAGMAGELGLAGRQQVSEELLGAVSARGANIQNLTSLAGVLKGARTRGVTQELTAEESSTASLLASIESMLEKTRAKTRTTGTGVESTKGFNVGGSLKGGISLPTG